MLDARQFWTTQARFVAWKQNLASWLSVFLPMFLGVTVFGSCAVLVLRRQEKPLATLNVIVAPLLFFGVVISLQLRWKKFWTLVDGLVRLEISMRLHNALTTAFAEVSPWPQPVEKTDDALHWRWSKIFLPLIAGIVLWLAALWIPVSPLPRSVSHPQELPPNWTAVENMVETLKQADVVEPASLQNIEDQLDTLRGQDAKEWYEHASLEAGDNLHAETAESVRELQNSLQLASEIAAKMMSQGDAPLTDNDLKAMNQALSGALQNLENGKLGLNKELLKKLQKMDPKALKPLSPEHLAQLQKQLQKGEGACKSCLGGGMPNQGGKKVFAGLEQKGQSGGTGGGGGPAPLTAKENVVNLHSKETDIINNEDLSRALPGDVVGLTSGEHQVDPTKNVPATAGGGISSHGEGGQAVWKDNLTPAERATLGRYFR